MRADFFGDTLVGPTILRWGCEEQKQDFLPPIMRGEISVPGLQRAGAGSDLASLKARAELDGDGWVLNGQKVWTTRTLAAGYVFCSPAPIPRCRSTRASRASSSMELPGIEVRPIAARRLLRVQRGLLRQCPVPEGQRGRWREQRVGGRQHHARLRARRRRRRRTVGSNVSSNTSSRSRGRTARSTMPRSASG